MLKSLFSIIIAYVIGNNGAGTKVYEAPIIIPSPTPILVSTPTPSKAIIATSTKISTSVKATPKPTKIPQTNAIVKKVTPTPTETPKQPEFVLPQVDFEKVNTFARNATVNIICTTKGSELSPISGTGVLVSPKGVIVTNAHIGQYFLLKDFKEKNFVDCKIRTGSPAYPTYNAELMYISPTWIRNNSKILKQQNPTGTGENDFAFLRITGRIDGQNIPDRLPFLLPDIREYILRQEPVILISYPAGFLGGLSILQDLSAASSVTNIKDYYTFKKDTIDVLDVGGTILSQKGSSGGAVVDSFVSLLGIITTSSEANTTAQRDLRAITLAHVNRTLQNELGFGVDKLLTNDPAVFSQQFASSTAPELTKILIDTITN